MFAWVGQECQPSYHEEEEDHNVEKNEGRDAPSLPSSTLSSSSAFSHPSSPPQLRGGNITTRRRRSERQLRRCQTILEGRDRGERERKAQEALGQQQPSERGGEGKEDIRGRGILTSLGAFHPPPISNGGGRGEKDRGNVCVCV